MLKDWEQKLLVDVLSNPEDYNSNGNYNDWSFPDYMSENQQWEMLESYHEFNGNPEQSNTYTRPYMCNFMVPYYLKCRLKEEGIV